MSNKNYRNYNQNYNKTNYAKPEVAPVEVTEEVVEVVEEVVEETPEITVAGPIYGVVTGCKKLNIRKRPTTEADPICVVEAGAKLIISNDYDIEDWYKVCTESGVEGYCMKEYVSLK